MEHFEIASDWDSDLTALSTAEGASYRFSPSWDFAWDEVLNHRIENGLCFHHRGHVAEGYLLAVGRKPIRLSYPDQRLARLQLAVTDQFGNEYSAETAAVVERSSNRHESRLANQPFPDREAMGLRGSNRWSNESRT